MKINLEKPKFSTKNVSNQIKFFADAKKDENCKPQGSVYNACKNPPGCAATG